jgi:hypothetical protein
VADGRKKPNEGTLLAHIEVLRERAKGFSHETEGRVQVLVRELLENDSSSDDLETLHAYADKLEELVPLIADDKHLRTYWPMSWMERKSGRISSLLQYLVTQGESDYGTLSQNATRALRIVSFSAIRIALPKG